MATLTCPVIDLTKTECKESERTCPICMEEADYESCTFCPGCIVPICTEPCLENHLYSPYGDKCPVCNYEWDEQIMGLKANIFEVEYLEEGVHPLDLKEEEQRNFDIQVKAYRVSQEQKKKLADLKKLELESAKKLLQLKIRLNKLQLELLNERSSYEDTHT